MSARESLFQFLDWRAGVVVCALVVLAFIALVAYRREMWLRGKQGWWL